MTARASLPFALLAGFGLATGAPRIARAAESEPIPAALTDAANQALAFTDAKVTIRAWKPTGSAACLPTKASIERPINGSGRYPAKVEGPGCGAWAWVDVDVRATAYITTRALRAGETLDGAVTAVEREVRSGRVPTTVGPGARTTRALMRGQMIEAGLVQVAGVAAGTPVKVLVRAGALSVVQSGRIVPCSGGRVCAVMPSGKHVDGVMMGDQLVVEAP